MLLVLGVTLAGPGSASGTALPAKTGNGTHYLIWRNGYCPGWDDPTECGGAMRVQIKGKKVRYLLLQSQANGVGTKGWARISHSKVKGTCTNGFDDWACDNPIVRFSARGNLVTPSFMKRVSRAKAVALYPGIAISRTGWES